MNDYEGAIGSGADYPDKALARKAAADILAGRAKDKEAGLAQGKQASFGGLGRLFQGNIDAPGSEASDKYGAGAGATMRTPAAPPKLREGMGNRNMEKFDAVPEVSKPMTPPMPVGNMANAANMPSNRYMDEGPSPEVGPAKPKNRIVSKAELAKSGMTLRDFLNKERGLKRRPDTTDYEAALKSVAKGKATPNPRDAELGVSRGMRKNPLDEQPLKKGGSVKAYASGGSVSSRADGCAQRGKTRGMMR